MGFFSKLFASDEAAHTEPAGQSAQATIVSLSESGPYVNNRPTITMVLEVEPPGGRSYPAQARQVVGRLIIGRLQPGATIPVRVDQDDPSTVTVDELAMLGRIDALPDM